LADGLPVLPDITAPFLIWKTRRYHDMPGPACEDGVNLTLT